MPSLDYLHVDVFSVRPYGGNSLPVFYDAPDMSASQMLAITQELRQFETIFLQPTSEERVLSARIFDLYEELPFAGHPLVGAAAALEHLQAGPDGRWTFDLSDRRVQVLVEGRDRPLSATLDAGAPEFLGDDVDRTAVARAYSLAEADLDDRLPLEVASTGLCYLVVPVRPGVIGKARVAHDLSRLLQCVGAQFAVLLDADAREIRHWNNDGLVEDVATGSAASVVAGYCVKHRLAETGEAFAFAQGRFAGRPSRIEVRVDKVETGGLSVKVGGPVSVLGRGSFHHAPEPA